MKAARSFKCLFWAIVYCILHSASVSSEDDLMDFDFTDLKEIDWNYDNDNSNETIPAMSTQNGGLDNVVNFHADEDEYTENQVHPFDWREKVLRNALSKALTNKVVRQKFIEVMPILRVLSSQQRLALSAIITAQVNAKKGQELKLEQVRMMFGNDKKLLIPIIYDIANLVGNSARKYLQSAKDTLPNVNIGAAVAAAQYQQKPAIQIERRKLDLIDTVDLDTEDIGALPSAAMAMDSSLEDILDELSDDVLDPQSINEELQSGVEKSKTTKSPITIKRSRRNADATSTDFVHKLIRSIPLSVNEDDLQRGAAGRTVKLNTTSFAVPNENDKQSAARPTVDTQESSTHVPSYQEIEDLAFASLNGTEINLSDNGLQMEHNETVIEPLPNPEELIAGPRYRINGNKIRLIRPKIPPAVAKRKRVQLPRLQQRIKGPYAASSSTVIGAASVSPPRKCERFTASMCIRTEDYPLDQIMGSIRRHKNAMSALLAEYHDKPLNLDFSDEFDEFSYNQRRREDEAATGSGGSMCQSIVRYARPQKARSASGEWKYIVNTGQHTQTLRLEKCSNPQESCSYLAHNYRSHCAQIYNYHRLLSWDKTRGLHVDIFKVPTCCSCQIDGYRQQFPPLDTIKSKEFSPAYNPEPYSTINEELDYNDEEDDDDVGLPYGNKYNQHKRGSSNRGYDINELQLGSQNIHTKTHAPSPTVGSYLSPPGSNEYDTNYAYKTAQHQHNHRLSSAASTSRHPYSSQFERRRPYKSLNHGFDTESRADLEIAPSETHTDKEVNIFGTSHANDKSRQVQQKRKRIYSVPHTATTSIISTISDSSSPVITTATNNSTYIPTQGHGYRSGSGSGNGNGHKHGHGHGYSTEYHQGFPGSSSSAAVTHQTTATSPSYYTPGAGKHIIRSGSGSSKSRFSSTSSTSQSYIPSSATSLPTTESTAYRGSMGSAPSYPPLYHIGSVFNTSTGHVSNAAGSKRINYSYHPIIDFFESNSKRSLSPSSSSSLSSSSISSKSPPTFPTVSTYEERPTRSTVSSHGQLYPHKIRKYSSVSRTKSSAELDLTDGNANDLKQQRERRIGIGADDGSIIGKTINDPRIASTSNEDNVWHPVLV